MKYSIVISFILLCISCQTNTKTQTKYQVISDPKNPIIDSIQSLTLEYVLWGCNCPNWVNTDLKNDSNLIDYCIYIEPASDDLKMIDSTFNISKQAIIVSGSFHVFKGYAKGTMKEEEYQPKARVFKYQEMRIIDKLHTTQK